MVWEESSLFKPPTGYPVVSTLLVKKTFTFPWNTLVPLLKFS